MKRYFIFLVFIFLVSLFFLLYLNQQKVSIYDKFECSTLTGYEECCINLVEESNRNIITTSCKGNSFFLFYIINRGEINDCSNFYVNDTNVSEFIWVNNKKEEICKYLFLQFNNGSKEEIDKIYNNLIEGCFSSGNSMELCEIQTKNIDINSETPLTPITSIKAYNEKNISLCNKDIPNWEKLWCNAMVKKDAKFCYPCGLP